MRRLVAICLASVLALVAAGAPALAGPQWCEQDPVFTVGGNVIDVTTTFASEHIGSIRGAIEFELLVPKNALLPAVVTLAGPVPMRAWISKSLPAHRGLTSMPVKLRISMDATRKFITYTRITGVTWWGERVTLLETVEGSSKKVQKLSFTLPLSVPLSLPVELPLSTSASPALNTDTPITAVTSLVESVPVLETVEDTSLAESEPLLETVEDTSSTESESLVDTVEDTTTTVVKLASKLLN